MCKDVKYKKNDYKAYSYSEFRIKNLFRFKK